MPTHLLARILTLLVLGSIGWLGQRWSPCLSSSPAAPDGLAVTPLRVHMEGDGSVGIWGWPSQVQGEGMALAVAMRTAVSSLPEATREQLAELHVYWLEDLFNGWLRVHVDPETPFGEVWQLFMGPGRGDWVYKFVFDGSGHAPPVFVQMPPDFDGLGTEDDRAVWWIKSSASGTGVRHLFGRYLGDSTMAIAHECGTGEAALAVIGAETPRLVVDPGVPWSEVEVALRGLAKNGISWWPVLEEQVDLVRLEERYEGFVTGCVGP